MHLSRPSGVIKDLRFKEKDKKLRLEDKDKDKDLKSEDKEELVNWSSGILDDKDFPRGQQHC